MPTDIIRYDLLVQEALRSVVRKVLGEAGKTGLPGDHHFFITFRTHARGVRLSNRMRERYPNEMTIVLQHQFWDLHVHEHAFEVALSFSGVSEKLVIPFDAIVAFRDDVGQFELKFNVPEDAEDEPEQDQPDAPEKVGAKPQALPKPARAPERSPRGAASEPAEAKPGKPTGPKAVAGPKSRTEKPESQDKKAGEEAKVVSIDAFRKKP